MRKQKTENRERPVNGFFCSLFSDHCSRRPTAGFTLIETLAAITLLVVAIVSPMLLTERSLISAYYARDQITAYYLAQEAIEAIHQIRDNNILTIAEGQGSGVDLFAGVPVSNSCTGAQTYFTVDATKTVPGQIIVNFSCGSTPDSCPLLQTKNNLYGYGTGGDNTWITTNFKRSVYACYVDPAKTEVHLSVTITWQTSSIQSRTFTISTNLYRWIQDGSDT